MFKVKKIRRNLLKTNAKKNYKKFTTEANPFNSFSGVSENEVRESYLIKIKVKKLRMWLKLTRNVTRSLPTLSFVHFLLAGVTIVKINTQSMFSKP